jgi:predicted ATP-grasp superfamily ATP-dependent carboligase
MSPRPDSRPGVLVTDAERPHGLAIVRSLGRAGRRVVAASHDPACPAFRSRFVAERLLVPSPGLEPAAFVAVVAERVSRRDIALIIPTTEPSLIPLIGARADLERHARLAAAESPALETVLDKVRTVELAERLGVPVPPTRRLDTVDDIDAAALALELPVVVKPSRSVRFVVGQGVRPSPPVLYARRWDEVAQHLRAWPADRFVCQRAVYGEGVGIEGLFDGGRPLALFQHVRVRELPLSGGGSTCRRSEPLDAELARHVTHLMEALRWTGVAMVEWKRAGRWGTLIEINGRFWGSLPLALAAGVDFPALLADLLIDGRAIPPATYRVGVVRIDVARDIEWAKAVLARQQAGLAAPPARLRAFEPMRDLLLAPSRADLWAPDDPAAFATDLLRVALGVGETLTRALRRA